MTNEYVDLFLAPELPISLGSAHSEYMHTARLFWRAIDCFVIDVDKVCYKRKAAKLFDDMVKEEFELQAQYRL